MTPPHTRLNGQNDRHAARADAESVTVLLTDDDDDLRETERIWLADDDWATCEATDGQEALAKLDATIDVLVLDQRMPNVTGPEVLARLDETTFDGSIVLVSAEDPGDSLNAHPEAVSLKKPISREAFVTTLDVQAP